MRGYYKVRGTAINSLSNTLSELLNLASTETWHDQAECRRHDPDMWFPVSSDGYTTAAAKAICGRCPVKQACLEWSLNQDASLNGIWGGLGEDDRMKLRRRAKRRAAA